MKKYYFGWYNYIAQSEETIFILAKDIIEAKQIAILFMQFFGGSRYTEDDIEYIDEVDDECYYTMDEIIERYKACGKDIVIPEIKSVDEED